MAAVTQYYALLVAIEGYILIARYCLIAKRVVVKQAFHRFAITKMGLGNLRGVFNRHLGIEDALRFDDSDGALLAETMAASEIYFYSLQTQPGYFFFQGFPNFKCFAGDTSCPMADKDGALVNYLFSWLFLWHQRPP
jgi:hypothetical protein